MYDWWTFGSNPENLVSACLLAAHTNTSATAAARQSSGTLRDHQPLACLCGCPCALERGSMRRLPCLQPSCCNFKDDVLDEPRPPRPRCVHCACEIDTSCEAHSYAHEGIECGPCAMIR